MITYRLAYYPLLFAFVSMCAHAGNTMECAIKDTLQNNKPAYVDELLLTLRRKIKTMAVTEPLNTPQLKRTWLISMANILTEARHAAHRGQSESIRYAMLRFHTSVWDTEANRAIEYANYFPLWGDGLHNASEALEQSAERTSLDGVICDRKNPWNEVWLNARQKAARTIEDLRIEDEARKAGIEGAIYAAKNDMKASGISKSVAAASQWMMLNMLVENAEELACRVNCSSISVMHKLNPKDDKFDNEEHFSQFYLENFKNLSDQDMRYLVALFDHAFPLEWIPEVHRHLFN